MLLIQKILCNYLLLFYKRLILLIFEHEKDLKCSQLVLKLLKYHKFYLINKGKMTVKWALLMASGKFAPFFEVFIISLIIIAIFYHIRALSNSKKVWKKELKISSYQSAYIFFQVSMLSFFEILKDFREKSIVFFWVTCDCDPSCCWFPYDTWTYRFNSK